MKLYRTEVDPAERFDRFQAQPRVARRMMRLAKGIRDRRLGAAPDVPDAQVLDRLRALGYME